MRNKYILLLIISVAFLIPSCDSGPCGIVVPYHLITSYPPYFPPTDLSDASNRVQVEGLNFMIKANLCRDFMPSTPPDGRPLSASISLIEVDSLDIKQGIDAVYIWVIHEEEVWISQLFNRQSWDPPYKLVRTAWNGPKWGPNVTVDVVVGIMDPQYDLHLIREEDVLIVRTQ